MDKDMKDNGLLIKKMGMDNTNGPMDAYIRATILKEKEMA